MVSVVDFKPSYQPTEQLPPANIEVEEAVLGMILLNSEAIYRIADFLPIEAFYISAHRDIYQAILALQKRKTPVELLTVTNYLEEKNILLRVGGRNKLARLVDRCVGDTNIDHLAWLLVDKFIKRQLLTVSHEITSLVFDSEIDTPQMLSKVEEKILNITECPLKHRQDDYEKWQYNNLINAVREIELTVEDPGLKMLKMHNLAKKHGNNMSVPLLETIYYKSLLNDHNEPAMTLSEFEAKYGQMVNEWTMHGLLPKGKVVLLYAKGGEGKTRIAYELGLHLSTGQNWGGFPVNGKNRLLYVQTDESPNDTLSVLKARGYENTTEIFLKSKWTVDHTESLKKEIQRLGVQFVLIDSLSTINKNSLFSENDVEYARPILKLKDIAQELGVTILIIHHASKSGDSRGTSAIFASVSEVWKLERDLSQEAPSDGTGRLLTIEKSRSRAPAVYKLQFHPEDQSWSCTGKLGEIDSASASLKDQIVDFLEKHRGVAYEAEELSHELGGNLDSVRRALLHLAEDGVISKKELIPRKGRPQRYYLPSYGYNEHTTPANYSDRANCLVPLSDPSPQLSDPSVGSENFPPIASTSAVSDHGINLDGSENFPPIASTSAVSDPHPPKNSICDLENKSPENSDHGSERAESQINQGNFSDPLSDPLSDPVQILHQDSDRVVMAIAGSKADITIVKRFKRYIQCRIEYAFADGSAKTLDAHPADLAEAQQIALVEIQQHQQSNKPNFYRVRQLGEDDYFWIENCQLIETPQPPIKQWYIFQAPSGETLRVRGVEEFESM